MARNHYQIRASLPGGRVIVCGAAGRSRDRVRQYTAWLLHVDEKHLTVTRIPDRPHRARAQEDQNS